MAVMETQKTITVTVTLADLNEIISWSGDSYRPDYCLLGNLEKLRDELESESKPACLCCNMDCCTDPEDCCQNHTCGKTNYQVVERTIREIVPKD
jgi:hypothetical protein